jgi:hypothetical protein
MNENRNLKVKSQNLNANLKAGSILGNSQKLENHIGNRGENYK